MQGSVPTELVFPPRLIKTVVEAKASEPPHVLKLWLGVSKGILPVKFFHSYKDSIICH